MGWQNYIPQNIQELYEIHDYKHAAAILAGEFPDEFNELCMALEKFRFSIEDVLALGGNESNIPKKFSELFRPMGWHEKQLGAELRIYEIKGRNKKEVKEPISYDTHKVDFLENRVAFDLEWNSKDQTFDRDLYAFRAFFDYDAISVGVLVTRSNELDQLFIKLDKFIDKDGKTKKVKNKYGASTTHMGKLLPRLEAGRNGGCPVLVLGITSKLLTDKEI